MPVTDLREDDRLLPPRAPRMSASAALRRHWIRALLPVLVLGGAAAGAGLARTPNYDAEARLAVGRVDASTPGALAGFTSTSQALAETYSRTLTADIVVDEAARRLAIDPAEVRGHIAAAPIPETPVFRVTGTATSQAGAVRLTNAAADALVSVVTAQQQASPDSGPLLRDFGRASRRLAAARARARRIEREAGDDVSADEREAIVDADAAVSRAQLRADTLSDAYQQSLQGAGSSGVIDVIQSARAADSDRNPMLQLLIFIGVVAGAAVGIALALLAGNREARRAA